MYPKNRGPYLEFKHSSTKRELNMKSVKIQTTIHQIKRAAVRTLLICGLAVIMAATLIVAQEPMAVSAAPLSATTVRQDRRPDRERPVTTSQGSGSTTTHSRPRLVRR